MLITLTLLADSLGKIHLPFINTLENHLYDWRLTSTMPKGVDDRIVIADIDEASLTEIGKWPWRRDIMAKMVNTLFDHYQIKQLGFDSVFPEADKENTLTILKQLANKQLKDNSEFQQTLNEIQPQLQYDKQFSESLKNRNIVLGYVFKKDGSQKINALPAPLFAEQSPIIQDLYVAKPNSFTANQATFQQAAPAAGFFDNDAADIDGVYRRANLIQAYDNYLYPSLALSMLQQLHPDMSLNVDIQNYDEHKAVEAVKLAYLNIPLNERGEVYVPFRGREKSFVYASIKDILNKTYPIETLKDKIVIFGASAAGMLDLRSTPVQASFPGVEIHANIIAGALDGVIKGQPTYLMGLDFAIILLSGLLLTFILPKLNPYGELFFTLGLSGLVIAINFVLWNQHLILPLAGSLTLILLIFIIQSYYGFVLKSLRERQITHIFGQYIPPEVVTELSSQEDKVDLRSKNKEMTVLFTDIRDFTTISESLPPNELSELMNNFLTPMTHAIYKQRGTIDKYMGDAVMAFWGAPLEHDNHASKCLNAAFDMLEQLEQLKPTLNAKGWPSIEIGIGINSGPMNVGNMGSQYRVAYTVLGDAVNMGSRLEGLTKYYGCKIIVSEHTKKQASEFAYLQLDKVRVKGKSEPVTIFEPLILKDKLSQDQDEIITLMDTALNHYFQQQWQEAKVLFEKLNQRFPHKTFTIYLNRIQDFLQTPPDHDWDGVTNHH